MSFSKIGLKDIQNRQADYIVSHYLVLHGTVISLAIASAGTTAAGLLTSTGDPAHYLVALWGMWTASFLATVVAYTGPMIGASALPRTTPGFIDLIAPLLTGIVEILLFTIILVPRILETRSAPDKTFNSVVTTWLFLIAVFGIAAFIGVWRARYHIQEGLHKDKYKRDIIRVIKNYEHDLGDALLGITSLILFAAIAGSLRIIWGLTQPQLALLSVLLIIPIIAGGIFFNVQTGKKLKLL